MKKTLAMCLARRIPFRKHPEVEAKTRTRFLWKWEYRSRIQLIAFRLKVNFQCMNSLLLGSGLVNFRTKCNSLALNIHLVETMALYPTTVFGLMACVRCAFKGNMPSPHNSSSGRRMGEKWPFPVAIVISKRKLKMKCEHFRLQMFR